PPRETAHVRRRAGRHQPETAAVAGPSRAEVEPPDERGALLEVRRMGARGLTGGGPAGSPGPPRPPRPPPPAAPPPPRAPAPRCTGRTRRGSAARRATSSGPRRARGR